MRTIMRLTIALNKHKYAESFLPGGIELPELFGERRKRLMRHLLRNKAGATIDALSVAIGVTRTAVRQHLAALMRDGFAARGGTRPTGGRPEQLYVLTDRGKEE